jgi:hypothetical protein
LIFFHQRETDGGRLGLAYSSNSYRTYSSRLPRGSRKDDLFARVSRLLAVHFPLQHVMVISGDTSHYYQFYLHFSISIHLVCFASLEQPVLPEINFDLIHGVWFVGLLVSKTGIRCMCMSIPSTFGPPPINDERAGHGTYSSSGLWQWQLFFVTTGRLCEKVRGVRKIVTCLVTPAPAPRAAA